jgi:hypothetical protein
MSDVRYGVSFVGIISFRHLRFPTGIEQFVFSAGVVVSRGGAEDAEGWLRHYLFRPELRGQGEYIFTGIRHFLYYCWRRESSRARRINEIKEKRRAAAQRIALWQPFL